MEKWISRSPWQRQISPRLTFCLLTVNTLDDVIYMTYLLFSDLHHFTTQPPTWVAAIPLNQARCWSSSDSHFSSRSLCSPQECSWHHLQSIGQRFRRQRSKPIAVKSSIPFPHQRNKNWTSNMPSRKEGGRLGGISPTLLPGRQKLSLEETTPVSPSQQLLRWAPWGPRVCAIGTVKEGRRMQAKVSPGERKELWPLKVFPYVHPSSFPLSPSLTRCASFKAAFTRTPLVMQPPGCLPWHFPFLIPRQSNGFPWEAPRGNGLSSVPFWCSAWFESAHPELPGQSNPAEANGNLLQRIQWLLQAYTMEVGAQLTLLFCISWLRGLN